jgi:hypothetical protein
VPVIIGNKLACSYRQGPDLLEVSVDVTSSVAARTVLQVVKGACKGIVCDLFVLIEGQVRARGGGEGGRERERERESERARHTS